MLHFKMRQYALESLAGLRIMWSMFGAEFVFPPVVLYATECISMFVRALIPRAGTPVLPGRNRS